jgi:hypothetical protein
MQLRRFDEGKRDEFFSMWQQLVRSTGSLVQSHTQPVRCARGKTDFNRESSATLEPLEQAAYPKQHD